MAKKKSFYAVRRGRQTGIFEDWDTVKGLTNGFPKPEFKGFQTRQEAEAYLSGSAAAPAAGVGGTGSSKWYGIRQGRQTGVFFGSWPDVQKLVVGVPSAAYKSFSTEAAARNFVGLAPNSTAAADTARASSQTQGVASQAPPRSAMATQNFDDAAGPSNAATTSGQDEAGARAAKRARVQPQAQGSIRMMFDGGSRGNPGRAGYGYAILDQQGQPLFQGCRALQYGSTCNQAEYSGLIAGLKRALSMGFRDMVAVGDSELIVKQMQGLYLVKSDKLRPLHVAALELAQQFDSFGIQHVLREENQMADALANLAMDIDEAIETISHMPPTAPRVAVARVLGTAADLHHEDMRTMLLEPECFLDAAAVLVARICDQQEAAAVRAQLLARGWTEQTGELGDDEGGDGSEEDAEEADNLLQQQLQRLQQMGRDGSGNRQQACDTEGHIDLQQQEPHLQQQQAARLNVGRSSRRNVQSPGSRAGPVRAIPLSSAVATLSAASSASSAAPWGWPKVSQRGLASCLPHIRCQAGRESWRHHSRVPMFMSGTPFAVAAVVPRARRAFAVQNTLLPSRQARGVEGAAGPVLALGSASAAGRAGLAGSAHATGAGVVAGAAATAGARSRKTAAACLQGAHVASRMGAGARTFAIRRTLHMIRLL